MTTIKKLRSAKTVEDVALLLGYRPPRLSYLLYRLADDKKYTRFQIAKKSGGFRVIDAPVPKVKLLQRRLANVLYECREDIEEERGKRRPLSHGFRRKQSILTNARPHKHRRFVLNLDLEEFFPTFNFGRVSGFFMKSRDFKLDHRVAIMLAQIACHEKVLPQGSPCSPIISDMIAHMLDLRLATLARDHGCTYTRYADDITFSTNLKEFPKALAFLPEAGEAWQLGTALTSSIERGGFKINAAKTRMQCEGRRQSVTGLTVNRKVNVAASYYRNARAMVQSLLTNGSYRIPGNDDEQDKPHRLEGILNHIYYVRDQADLRERKIKRETPNAAHGLYRRLLFYIYFVALDKPIILCEGKTDVTYLREAIRSRVKMHPTLAQQEGKTLRFNIRFLNYTDRVHDILQLGGGTGDLKFFALQYADLLAKIRHRPLRHPVILLTDNDKGGNDLFSGCNGKLKTAISIGSTAPFYKLGNNLYLIKTPEDKNRETMIEHCFEQELLNRKLDGKTFNPDKKLNPSKEYGKAIFAEKIVRADAKSIKFDGFDALLERITKVIEDYEAPEAGYDKLQKIVDAATTEPVKAKAKASPLSKGAG